MSALSLLFAVVLAACVQQAGEPAYDADQCYRTALIDIHTGDHITGAEDIAFDPEGNRLIISAYDRRAVEHAARRKAAALPEGGLYEVGLSELMLGTGRLVAARPLLTSAATEGGLRPHGVDFDPFSNEIVFINRSYRKVDGRWQMTPMLERLALDQTDMQTEAEQGFAPVEAPCSANDIAAAGQASLVTYDHGACGWRAFVEDAFSLKRSGIARPDDQTLLYDGVGFANGLARLGEQQLAVAATRESAIIVLAEASDGAEQTGSFREQRRISLPGGPDNLTVSADGSVIAAVHPSLLWIGAHRKLGLENAPSRLVKVDPATGDVSLLYDDRRGSQFSAATVGVEADGLLVAGSVTERGILVCRAPRLLADGSGA